MSQAASKTVNIFLSLDKNVIPTYFNPHDATPMYKRQLSMKFQQYIAQSLKSCKRYDPVFFKLTSTNRVDEQFELPVMYSIRRHFTIKKEEELKAFAKFKRKNYGTILVSLIIVAVLNFLLPVVMTKDTANNTGLSHFIDVFSFVIFYHPLTELLFNWNPYLKRINLYNKLIKAEAILVPFEKGAYTNKLTDFDVLEDFEPANSH